MNTLLSLEQGDKTLALVVIKGDNSCSTNNNQSCEDNCWFILGFYVCHSVLLAIRLPVKYCISNTCVII